MAETPYVRPSSPFMRIPYNSYAPLQRSTKYHLPRADARPSLRHEALAQHHLAEEHVQAPGLTENVYRGPKRM